MKGQSRKSMFHALFMLIALMMLVFIPVTASAEGTDGEEAEGFKVYMTVVNKGELAVTKSGEAMARQKVIVNDINGDGKYSYDEALVAAHDTYFEGGAAAGYESGVTKLWGVENDSGYIFYQESEPISSGVTGVYLEDGQYLIAVILKEAKISADWITFFDKQQVTAKVDEAIKLNLTGHLAMSLFSEEDSKSVPIDKLQIGVWENGAFQGIDGAITDEDGNVRIAFDKPGTYVVSVAPSTIRKTITSRDAGGMYFPFSGLAVEYDDKELWGLCDYTAMDFYAGWTEKDYGDGPYPYEELNWIKVFSYSGDVEFDPYEEETFDKGYFMYSGVVDCDCPVIPAVCIVTIPESAKPADMKITINNKGIFASAKDGTAMVERDITVTDLNEDGMLSYDEALVAAHDTYFEGGTAAGYSGGPWISKLWGVGTSNTLMFDNDESISPATVDEYELKEVEGGHKLYASVNTDDVYYADWFTTFDIKEKTLEAGQSLALNIKGHYGMAYEPEDMIDVPLEGIHIGYWKDGDFQPLEGIKTDSDGNATVTFDKAGIYIVTADGTVKDMVYDYSDYPDIKEVEADCPIIPPYCIVTVTRSLADADIKVASATYTGKNLTPAVTVKVDGVELTRDKDYTLTYANNKNAGKSAKVTVTGKGVYLDSASKTFTISKTKQPMVVKIKNKTFKAKALKKKKQTYKAVNVTKNQGAVSYKATLNKKAKKALKFAKGKIVVKKGAKKGTYKVKVVVTAKGNANYLKGSVTKNIKVTVK